MLFSNLIQQPEENKTSFGVQNVSEQPFSPTPKHVTYVNNMNPRTYVQDHSKDVSFGSMVNPIQYQNQQNTGSVGINMDYLIRQSQSTNNDQAVNMSVNPREVPSQQQNPVPAQWPSFNKLISEAPTDVNKKFSLQPIEDGYDRSMLPKQNLASSALEEINSHLSKNTRSDRSGKRPNNWFTRMIDQKGEDYFDNASVDDISRNAEKIIDDMISGRIDYNKIGSIIIKPVIIETLINYCSNKLAINKAIQYSLGYLYNDYTNKMNFVDDTSRMAMLGSIDDSLSRNISQAISIEAQDIAIYEILYNKFMFVNATKNASSLLSLPNDLSTYNKMTKKRY